MIKGSNGEELKEGMSVLVRNNENEYKYTIEICDSVEPIN